MFAFTDTDARPTSITWNGTTADIGRLKFHGQNWTVRAHLEAARYAKYDRSLAARPALISTPDELIISYPMRDRESVHSRLLLHAPHFVTWRYPHLGGPIGWTPRELTDGRVVQESTLATIEDSFGPIPIVARHDQALIDIGDGDVRDLVVRLGNEGADRQFVLPVNSMEHLADDLFRRLAEHGSLC